MPKKTIMLGDSPLPAGRQAFGGKSLSFVETTADKLDINTNVKYITIQVIYNNLIE